MMESRPAISVEMAPMQGLTDHIYRRIYKDHFVGVDFFYCPFVMLQRGTIRGRDNRELAAGREEGANFTPQIIASTATEVTALIEVLKSYGFGGLNLNVGCPFPMVTKRKRGSGLLPHPGQLEAVLEAIFSNCGSMAVSVKTRFGLESPTEFEEIIPVLNRFPLSKVVVHPRTGRMMYRGDPLWGDFERYAPELVAPVVANGDMEIPEDVWSRVERCSSLHGIMVGRGLLRDPFLPAKIKGRVEASSRLGRLRQFHDALYEAYGETIASPGHLLDKMRAFWSYFAESFDNPPKVFKRFKKNRDPGKYAAIVAQVFSEASG